MIAIKDKIGSQFNYCFEHSNNFFIYNTLNATIYKIENSKCFEIIKERSIINSTSNINESYLKVLENEGLVVDISKDEKKMAYDSFWDVVYADKLDVTIIPTQNCNFNCMYCFEEHKNYKMTDESEDRIIKFFQKYISKYRTIKISWFGGEPLLEKKRVIRIMRAIKLLGDEYKIPIITEMITNGYNLDEETFGQLLDNNVRFFEVTVDGFPEYHNSFRPKKNGENTYDCIISNLLNIHKKYKKKRFKIIVRSNLSKKSATQYKDFVEHMKYILENDKRFEFLGSRIVDWGGDSVTMLKDDLLNQKDTIIDSTIEHGARFSAVTHDVSQLRCSAGKYNGFIIMPNAEIHKCVKISYNASDSELRNFNKWGCISNSGQLVCNNEKKSKLYMPPKTLKKCDSCCWLPICMLTSCPYNNVGDRQILCKMDFIQNQLDVVAGLIDECNKGKFKILAQ